jgi:hypothetical protein
VDVSVALRGYVSHFAGFEPIAIGENGNRPVLIRLAETPERDGVLRELWRVGVVVVALS